MILKWYFTLTQDERAFAPHTECRSIQASNLQCFEILSSKHLKNLSQGKIIASF